MATCAEGGFLLFKQFTGLRGMGLMTDKTALAQWRVDVFPDKAFIGMA